MATNKRKVLLPHTMGKQGIDLMQSRDDIETIIYPAGISQADFRPLIADCSGVALSGTAFKQAEMDAAPAMQVVARIGVGYDAVEVPALTARGVPLMVAGSANSVSVAEQAFHFIIALAKLNHQMDRSKTINGPRGMPRRRWRFPARPSLSSVSAVSARAPRGAAWRST